jgi:signal recognition particle subunit SRP54
MLNALANSLSGIFSGLSGRGLLTESDVDFALRQLRLALLEADVALPVVKDLLTRVRVQAVGEKVLKSIQPAQQIVKILHDEVLATLGEAGTLTLNVPAPAVILLCGLQGGGKTTTAGKLALMLTKQGKSVMLASLDTYRPAAQQQLEI